MAPKCSLGVVAATLSFLFSAASAQSSNQPVEPAEAVVAETIVAGAPLLDVETVQLTDAVVARIASDDATAEYADLFAFESDASVAKRDLPSCKTYPGDALWPVELVWDIFDFLLGGQLIKTVPIAAPCYDSKWGSKDDARCSALISTFGKPATHENDPTSIMWPIFQGKTCMVREGTTAADKCTLGGFPEYALNASNVAQIQLALNFARNLNIRLVVKNTGHCYLGKSTGAGSLSIWTHNFQDIDFLPKYQATGYNGAAFRVGAGVTVQQIYRAAEAQRLSVLGGICESVGFVGGYLQGGGHTPLSGYYGMAADSVLAFQVVTADGRFVTASATSNPDLFWALRGGGGGTYGVVTSVIIKAHPKIDVTHSTFVLGNSTDGTQLVSRENFFKGVRKFFESFPTFTDAGTYSFFFIFNTNGQLTLDMKSFFAPGHTKESYNKLTKPFFDTAKELGIPFKTPQNSTYYPTFFSAYWDAWGKTPFPLGTATSLPGNRLIPKSHWTEPAKFEKMFSTLKAHVENGRHFGVYHQSPQNPQKVDNAVSSAWRNAQAFFITSSPVFAANADAATIASANKVLNEDILQPWRDITPASEFGGSYLNEAAVEEPKWQEDFYGTQYSKLLSIKKKYDPRGLFYATTAVGSEEWEVRDVELGVQTQNGKLCRK
ncbi:hypothetical protein BDV95DRAFT_625581 [Massariosphaeria phaeospora]|uniref:FAD-binding PCMH-type domain-containing protein n=1 Tax=Massariosphaeria phaeospora TaxID=100035 RepID=A0A7C8MGZ3_9PLEO|nr:hypothetical protein BDV95DRAFT_625581 [Massariosphaeria phaeospora]